MPPDPANAEQRDVRDPAAAWVVEFDGRSDDGARLVGPFPTKAEGHAWLARQTFDYEALVAPMEAPDAT